MVVLASANLAVAAYLLAVEHTLRGPGLLIVLAVILIVAASARTGRES